MMRAYKYRAFLPRGGREAFDLAVALRRGMFAALCAMQAGFSKPLADAAAALKAAKASGDDAAIAAARDALGDVRRARTAAVKKIKQDFAAKGLSWGDYNAVVFQFDGAVRSAACRGAAPQPSDAALGEAAVIQLMAVRDRHGVLRHARPADLLSRNDVRIEYLDDSALRARRKKGSRRWAQRTCRLAFRLRTDKNPLGEAIVTLDFCLHRPLPPDAHVVEARLIRTHRPVIRQGGEAATSERWHVVFVTDVKPPRVSGGGAAAVAFDWSREDEDTTNALVVAHSHKPLREITLGADHLAAWERSREMFAAADALEDGPEKQAALAEAVIFRRRLTAERTIALRTLAKEIAAGAAAVAAPATWLAGMGAKNWTAPAEFRRELKRAVENAGGLFVPVKIKKSGFEDAKKYAKRLLGEARAALLEARESEIAEAAQ